MPPKQILWRNKSVLEFAGKSDPIGAIEAKVRELGCVDGIPAMHF